MVVTQCNNYLTPPWMVVTQCDNYLTPPWMVVTQCDNYLTPPWMLGVRWTLAITFHLLIKPVSRHHCFFLSITHQFPLS